VSIREDNVSPVEVDYFGTANTEPWDFYAHVREAGGIVWDEAMDAWLVASYDIGSKLLRDERAFRHPATRVPKDSVYYELRGPAFPFFHEGEAHMRLHQWWRRVFSHGQAEEWRMSIVRPMTRLTLDRFAAQSHVELVDEYIQRIPLRGIAAIMDLPWEDDDWIAELKAKLDIQQRFWNEANSTHGGKVADEEGRKRVEQESLAARREMEQMVLPYIEARRHGNGDDLISRVWREGEGLLDQWGLPEVMSTLGAFLFAGTDTTVHSTANAFYLLLNDSELLQRVRSGDDETYVQFVDEALRLHGVVHFVIREAVHDAELDGVKIGEDEKVIVLVLAADRDRRQFPCGEDIALESASQRHLAFSQGPRYCIGSSLARVVMQETIRAAIHGLEDLRLDPARSAPTYVGFVMRSYRPLHTVFTPVVA
jgi:cytochrome P450